MGWAIFSIEKLTGIAYIQDVLYAMPVHFSEEKGGLWCNIHLNLPYPYLQSTFNTDVIDKINL